MITLASQSRTRQALLRNAGLKFLTAPPVYDEILGQKSYLPETTISLALHLATGKAFSLPSPTGNDIIIAADQTLSCHGRRYSKPATIDEARLQLTELRNRTHILTSAVVCRTAMDNLWNHVSHAEITMRDFSNQALESYLQQSTPEVLQSVGSYHYEGSGIQLIAKVEGDYHTILGLPVLPLLGYLRSRGFIPK